jgi:SAM-dependent methyltransferase
MQTTIRLLLAASVAAFLAACAQAPAKTEPASPAFVPHSGQEGKDVIWVPTPQALVDKMLDMARVTPQDYVIDLGSGDGRTVITAAKRGARALGIEYNPEMVKLSQQNAEKEGVGSRAQFRQGDLFESDFSQATVITLFLLPSINVKLRPKILAMKPGTRVVSNSFSMDTWEADETDSPKGCTEHWCTALLWIVPADFAGAHKVAGLGDLVLDQKFQVLTGQLRNAEGVHGVSGKVVGTEAVFRAGGRAYRLRLNGKALELLP